MQYVGASFGKEYVSALLSDGLRALNVKSQAVRHAIETYRIWGDARMRNVYGWRGWPLRKCPRDLLLHMCAHCRHLMPGSTELDMLMDSALSPMLPSEHALYWYMVLEECLMKQVGLGTDVAGGYSPSMLSAMRSAVITSKAVRMMHIDAARSASANTLRASAAEHYGCASSEPVPAAGDYPALLWVSAKWSSDSCGTPGASLAMIQGKESPFAAVSFES